MNGHLKCQEDGHHPRHLKHMHAHGSFLITPYPGTVQWASRHVVLHNNYACTQRNYPQERGHFFDQDNRAITHELLSPKLRHSPHSSYYIVRRPHSLNSSFSVVPNRYKVQEYLHVLYTEDVSCQYLIINGRMVGRRGQGGGERKWSQAT